MSENPEFKSIRNAVISAACDLEETPAYARFEETSADDDIIGIDVSDDDPWVIHPHANKTQDIASYTPETLLNSQNVASYCGDDSLCVTTTVTRLLNNVSRIFRDKFDDNPEHVPKVDIKLRQKILEKEQAHGIKHG